MKVHKLEIVEFSVNGHSVHSFYPFRECEVVEALCGSKISILSKEWQNVTISTRRKNDRTRNDRIVLYEGEGVESSSFTWDWKRIRLETA